MLSFLLSIGLIFTSEIKTIDLTHTLSEETTVYPGKKPFSRVICAYYQSGYRVDNMTLCTGIGTHMDAPNHFCPTGGGIETVSLSQCCGAACVIHLKNKVQTHIDYAITKTDIEEWEATNGQIPKGSIVLFYTGWDQYWGTDHFCVRDAAGKCHFPGVGEDAARLLVKRGVGAVGIDTMGMDVGNAPRYIAHEILLGARIPLVENLAQLDKLPPTGATVYMLPMKIKDAPEAPVRAIAILP